MKKITLLLMVAIAAINISAATIVIPEEAKAWNIPAEAIDVLQAREICAGLEADVPTTENYYVMGYVKRVSSKNAETVSQYGQARFYLENAKGANSEEEFDAYQVHGLNGVKINNPDVVAAGDFVVIYGPLTKHQYEGGDVAYQTPGKGAAYIWNSTNPKLHNDTATTPENPTDETLVIPDEAKDWNIPAEAIDVVKAREICAGLASGATSGTKYYVMGYVKKLHNNHASGVSGFGNATFYMENVKGANSEEDFLAYQVYGLNGEKITDPNVVAVGDFVVVYGELTKYQYDATSTPVYETTGKGSAYIWNSTNPLIAGDPNTVNIKGLQYADAYYYTEDEIGYFDFDMYVDVDLDTYEYTYPELYVAVKANSKTALNGTYDLLYACLWTSANDSIEMGEELGTVTITNVDAENNYSFKGSFVGADGKTYNFDDVMYAWGYDVDTDEEIVFSEESTTPPTPPTPPTDGAIVFDADVDKGNAAMDANNQTPYAVSKAGVTIDVTRGIIGTYNNENHYRIYKGQTLTVTSTVGNIAKIEFTCTANGDEKYGPGCFTASTGEYGHDGAAVGTWTGDAATVIFTASANQVRATQIVVTLANATAVEDVTVGAIPVKVIENGQVLIIRGENVYNVLGAQVK